MKLKPGTRAHVQEGIYSHGPVAYDGNYVDWRESAACKGADTDIFMTATGRTTRANFAEALSYCARCPVTAECDDASEGDDLRLSVRGGIIPRDRMKTYVKTEPYGDDMWRMYCANLPGAELRSAGGYGAGTHSVLMSALLNKYMPGPENATWGLHKAPTDKRIESNSGWLISISADGALYCVVIKNNRGQRLRVVREAKYVTLSDDVRTKGLPILTYLPVAYQSA